MPTNRPTKRFLLPRDRRARRIVEAILDDQSDILGISNSDVIIRDVLSSHLPASKYARAHAESVYAGDRSLLGDLASVLHANVTGSRGAVAHQDYRPLVDFGLNLVRAKGFETALDTSHVLARHFRNRFSEVVERIELHSSEEEVWEKTYVLQRKATYGRELLVEADPERFSRAPASAFIQYALEDFESLGPWNITCDYLADIFEILADLETRLQGDDAAWVPRDTAAMRVDWVETLANTTVGWGEP